jgi:NAD(P)-dependent dehydrogenase (short-subunit alcohol dehydrogenase family)
MSSNLLITGTSRGLGLSLARHFLQKNGHSVYGCSRGDCPLEKEFPGRYHHQQIDLADTAAAQKAFNALIDGVDGFPLVILNAGILPPIRDLRDTPLETLRETMEINVWANKWILDAVLSMPSKPQQVVAISSGAAVSGSRGWNAYSVSKAALNMLVKLYAAEEPSVHFTALAPGLVDTAMQEYISSIEDDADYETIRRLKAARNTPDMPSADEAASSIVDILDTLKSQESGAFVDIRKMAAG